MNADDLKKLNTFCRQKTKTELAKMCLEKKLSIKGTKHDLGMRLLGIEIRPKIPIENYHRPTILIHKNQYGRYIHTHSNLIFDVCSKKVIGKQDNNGRVHNLKRSDIQICKQYKFKYEVPIHLDEPTVPLGKVLYKKEEESSDDDEEDVSDE